MRSPASLWALCLALLLRVEMAASVDLKDAPAPKDFLRRNGARAIVVGDFVYIDGGEVSQLVDGKKSSAGTSANPVNSTLSIDVSQSWLPSDVEINTIKRQSPAMIGQALWTDADATAFYAWGGHVSFGIRVRDIATSTERRFAVDSKGGGSWFEETPSNPDVLESFTLSEDGAFVTARDTGFWIGGAASAWTDPGRVATQAVPGVVSFNITTKTWANSSASGLSTFGTLRAGAAEFVPTFGPNGLVMVLGGMALKLVPDNDPLEKMQSFATIPFFDPVTKKWYSQETSGTAPTPRSNFCTVGRESRNDTYEIFVFGGRDTSVNEDYGDVYILSLPGFVWTNVTSAAVEARSNHHCVVIGERQMLSVGGGSAKGGWSSPDTFPQGLGILDLSILKWRSSYDAAANTYESPDVVKAWYSEGSLSSVVWSSKEVQKLFLPGSVTEDPEPTQSPSQTSDSSGSGAKSTPVGAIVGGVIGGVAFLALVVAVVFFLRRRRRTPKQPDARTATTPTPATPASTVLAPSNVEYKPPPPSPPVELPTHTIMAELDGGGIQHWGTSRT